MPFALAAFRPFLKYIVGGLALFAVLWFVHHKGYEKGKRSRDPEIAALNQTIADVRIKTAQATAEAQSNARRIESEQDAITKETTDALEAKLVDARASAAAYAKRLRTQAGTDQGRCGQGSVAEVSDSAVPTDTAGGAALLDEDIRICSENTVKSQAWLDWYNAQQKVDRDGR